MVELPFPGIVPSPLLPLLFPPLPTLSGSQLDCICPPTIRVLFPFRAMQSKPTSLRTLTSFTSSLVLMVNATGSPPCIQGEVENGFMVLAVCVCTHDRSGDFLSYLSL